jgi:hypothetical protein
MLKVCCGHWIGLTDVICDGSAELVWKGVCMYSFSSDIFHDQACPWACSHVGASERSCITKLEQELTSTDGLLHLVNGKAEFWVEFGVSLLSSINQELLCINGRL